MGGGDIFGAIVIIKTMVLIPYPRERGPTTECGHPPLWAQFPAKV